MKNKNIIVGITGGIAAYKAAELARGLCSEGANVRVIMTKNAQEFITPLTLQTLSGNKVYTKMFTKRLEWDLEHIALARWADAVIIVPTSANFIAKLAHGLADDLLSTVCLATTAPIAIVPAMNKEMWQATVTQENISRLKKRDVFIFGPAEGKQACGEIGYGRMLEPKQILESIPEIFESQIFYGKKIVITAGPTREDIDPVRYISNYSSGKMGYALAEASQEAGAQVVLISGPTNLECSSKIKRVSVQTAEEMYEAVMKEIVNCDVFISAAAVADYRPISISKQKIKKSSEEVSITLKRNPDILSKVCSSKRKIFVVGFTAETNNLLANAKKKMVNKKVDMMIANKVGKNLVFDSNDNEIIILQKNATPKKLPKMSKMKLAKCIIDNIYPTMRHCESRHSKMKKSRK